MNMSPPSSASKEAQQESSVKVGGKQSNRLAEILDYV
jgi:hypothetical protein